MTIVEVIGQVDAVKPNAYPQKQKVAWLDAADKMIYSDVIKKHEGWEVVEPPEYLHLVEQELAVRYEYDEAGNMVQAVTVDGAVTRYEYDGHKNPVRILRPDGSRVEMRYNERGQLLASQCFDAQDRPLPSLPQLEVDCLNGKQLLAPAPYDQLYFHWLCSQIDLYNNEIARYQNSAALYNLAYAEFRNWYRRGHLPLTLANL